MPVLNRSEIMVDGEFPKRLTVHFEWNPIWVAEFAKTMKP